MTNELVDIVDEQGNATGQTILLYEAHRLGERHRGVHLWLYTQDGRILIQQRGAVLHFPFLFDASAAGHVHANEEPIDAAIRELDEELGIAMPSSNLQLIAQISFENKSSEYALHDREIQYVYIGEIAEDAMFAFQADEVATAFFLPLSEFETDLNTADAKRKYVSRPQEHPRVIESIRERLKK